MRTSPPNISKAMLKPGLKVANKDRESLLGSKDGCLEKLVKKPLSTPPKPRLGARARRMSLFSSSAGTLIPDSASSLEYCTPASSTASSDLSSPSKTYHVVNDGQILAHSRPKSLVPYDLRLRSEQLLKQMSLHIHHIEGFPEYIVGPFPMNSRGIAGRRACMIVGGPINLMHGTHSRECCHLIKTILM